MRSKVSVPSLFVASALGFIIARAPAAEPAATAVDTDILKPHLEAQGYACVDLTRTEAGYFVVAATLEGKDLSLIVDTGAPLVHLDPARLQAAGISRTSATARHEKDSGNPCRRFDSIRIGRMSTGPLLAVPNDVSPFNERLEAGGEPPVDGLLGSDVLIAHAAVIDLAEKRLYLRPMSIARDAPVAWAVHDAIRTELVAGGYACAGLDLNIGAYLSTDGGINGNELRLMVDTGAPSTHLDRRRTVGLNLKWRAVDYRPSPQAPLRRYASSSVDRLRIQSIEVGPQTVWSTEILSAVNESISKYGGEPFDGVLGANLMSGGAAVIDYPALRLYLKFASR